MQSAQPIAVAEYVDSLLAFLRPLLPRAIGRWDAQAIHHARVTTRRLKAVSDLLAGVTTAQQRKPLDRTLRKLRRRLGPLRDLDVMIEHLAELGGGGGGGGQRHGRAAQWVAAQLKLQRQRRRRNVLAKVSVPAILAELDVWGGLRQQIVQSPKPIAPILAASLRRQLSSFAAQSRAMAAACRPSASRARGKADPHALRIAGKALRYTLELAGQTAFKLPEGVLADFKRMQTALGLWHDYVVLSQQVIQLSLNREIASHDRALYQQLLSLAELLWRRAERELKAFVHIWDQRGRATSAGICQTLRSAAAG